MCTKKLKETPPQWVEGLRIFFRIVTICKVERKNKKGKVKRISPFMGNSVFSVILDRDSTRNVVVYLLRRVANLGPCHFLFFLSPEIDGYCGVPLWIKTRHAPSNAGMISPSERPLHGGKLCHALAVQE